MTRARDTANTQDNIGGAVAPSVAGKNAVLNSNMSIWQRGTANVTTASAYTADRWQKGSATFYGVSRQTTSDTTNLPNIQYCARVQRTAGNTTTTGMEFYQSFETVNSIPLIGKTVTISFYARKGANYSSATSSLSVQIYTGTGTDQNLVSFTGAVLAVDAGAVLTTTWQRFSATGTISTSATQVGVYCIGTPAGTAGANDYFEITGVQLELGSVATPYAPNGATYQAELAACQRYYQRYIYSGYTNSAMGIGAYYSTTACYVSFPFPVSMRVAPSFNSSAATALVVLSSGSSRASTAIALTQVTNLFAEYSVTTGIAVAGNAGLVRTNTVTDWLEFSGEL